MNENKDDEIVFVQGIILQSDLEELKEKTGRRATKDAVNVAIRAYLAT